jgi:uncharacterized membrane protein YfcA
VGRSGRLGEVLLIGLVAAAAGTLGTMLGLGGGVFLVPILSLAFGIDLRTVIAASALAVVANSASGSAVYLRARFTSVRLALAMQVPMVAGALAGGFLAVSLPEVALKGLFAALLYYVAFAMRRRSVPQVAVERPSALNDPHRLGGRYYDPAVDDVVGYVPHRLRLGLPGASLAGIASGMFGIGGGPITVPLYTLVMRVPVKAATSTSSFMFGLTASASAFIYYQNNYVDPSVAIPAVLGIIGGARIGAELTMRTRPRRLGQIFVFVMLGLATSMLLDALGVY